MSEKHLYSPPDISINRLSYFRWKIAALSEEKRNRLVGHDLRKDSWTIIGSMAQLKEDIVTSTDEQGKEYVRLINKESQIALNSLKQEDFNIFPPKEQRAAQSHRNILPILVASANLIIEPSEKNYSRLVNMRISAKDIGCATHSNISRLPEEDLVLNGIQGIIAFNAANNAVFHGIPGTTYLEEDIRGHLVIKNESDKKLPRDYFAFKEQETGGTGGGIIALYSSLLGKDPTKLASSVQLGEGIFEITMTVPGN